MKPMLLAGIDIGTNTFRLLIGEVSDTKIKEVFSERIVTRLGEGILRTGLLKKEAMDRGISALTNFRNALSRFGVETVSAVGTGALREAKNRDDFISAAGTTGIDVRIISDIEEARITSLGIMTDIDIPDSALLLDIGGGSTELIITEKGEIKLSRSIDLGALYLSDIYMNDDPPASGDLKTMTDDIFLNFKDVLKPVMICLPDNTELIGTAGTITALSAMVQNLEEFEHDRIHNTVVSLEEIEGIFTEISTITGKERLKRYPVLGEERINIIVPGILILLIIMKDLGFKEINVSDNGLREGILIDLYSKIASG